MAIDKAVRKNEDKLAKKKQAEKEIRLEIKRIEKQKMRKFPWIFEKINIILLFALIAAIFVLIIIIISRINVSSCADGTRSGECSKTSPFFCANNILAEYAQICGCNNVSSVQGDSCISNYQQQPKNISLNYIIKGQEKYINFTVYKNLSDYLFSLPVSIYYPHGQQASEEDFIMRDLNNEQQRQLLMPLVIEIQNLNRDKTEQARIAVSLVQNIAYGNSQKTVNFGGNIINYSRYPYNVLYDQSGVCGEKSELLVFLLRELGYNTAILYFPFENHEAVGIKCPLIYSYKNTGYCFVETTGPAIISDGNIEYAGIGKLYSNPDVIPVSGGISLGAALYEYKDALEMKSLRDSVANTGGFNPLQSSQYKSLKEKYGLQEVYNAG